MESSWRDDFEALDAQVYGHPLAYLDSAATTQMPRPVVERLSAYYAHEHANVHRGVHYLSERATDALEAARAHVASCLHAGDPCEVIFTSGATDSLNMAARGLAQLLEPGSAVVVSDLEHHSDYVPWQSVCEERGARFVLWRSRDGRLDLGELARLLDAHPVRVVAVTQVSNVTGTVLDLHAVAKLAHEHGALVVADGAQGILHEGVDVTAVGVDLYAFSAHKMFGPTGTGVLWGRRDVLERMEPARFGGGMVDEVGDEATSWASLPLRLEAGTPNISGIIGLDAALGYLERADVAAMRAHERRLLAYLLGRLEELPGLRVLGHPERRSALVSFELAGLSAFDVAFLLDKRGVAVRSGHHCAQPALRSLGVETCVRASLAPYNDTADVDALVDGLLQLSRLAR